MENIEPLPVRVTLKPGFHLLQTLRPRHKKQNDYVLEQPSFTLIALFWLKIGRCRCRNWLNGNQALWITIYALQALKISPTRKFSKIAFVFQSKQTSFIVGYEQ